MSAKTVLKAYAITPFAPAVLLAVMSLAGGDDPEHTFGVALMALIFSYIGGAFLLPLHWVYERLGWRGWRFYVPTAAGAGIVMAVWIVNSSQAPPYLLSVGCAVVCGALFSFLIGPRSPLNQGDVAQHPLARLKPRATSQARSASSLSWRRSSRGDVRARSGSRSATPRASLPAARRTSPRRCTSALPPGRKFS